MCAPHQHPTASFLIFLSRCSQVYGKTALDLATYKEHLSVVSILRQHEVDTELSFTNKLEQQRGVVPGMGF